MWFISAPESNLWMTKIKQTIEKLVSICRTVGMHSMREFVVHIYIYIQYLQSQVAFFFQLADHVTELCLDKVEANCKWLFFRQSKHDLYFSLPLCWLRAMPSADLCATHSRNCSRPGPAGTDGEPCSTVTSILDLLGQDVPHTAHGIVAMTLRWTEEQSALPISFW